MRRKVLNYKVNFISVLCIVIISLSIFQIVCNIKNPGRMPSIGGYRLMPILTGSMEPVFHAGDMIMIGEKSPDDIKTGDIITYRSESNIFIAHRVVDIVSIQNRKALSTKGDANNTNDRGLIEYGQIIGVMVFRIPYGGYITGFLRSWSGIILLMIIPLALLMIPSFKVWIKKNLKS